ncbi:hypothetical protein B0O99DRAFT_603341 [Bisporella sp. PMI_857]|nr:hypothetical protein B0O99DRAFT_603341 [Bisporella sp. PMI_857]
MATCILSRRNLGPYLGSGRGFAISEKDVVHAGKDPKMVVDVPASFGFPEGRVHAAAGLRTPPRPLPYRAAAAPYVPSRSRAFYIHLARGLDQAVRRLRDSQVVCQLCDHS